MSPKEDQKLVPWEITNLPSNLGSFWSDLWGDLSYPSGLSISEDKSHVYVETAVPGLSPENIDVSFDKGVLWIKGEKKEEHEDSDKKYYRKAASSYSYRVSLPEQVDETKEPTAECKDGVMKITFIKAKPSQAKKIPVRKGQ